MLFDFASIGVRNLRFFASYANMDVYERHGAILVLMDACDSLKDFDIMYSNFTYKDVQYQLAVDPSAYFLGLWKFPYELNIHCPEDKFKVLYMAGNDLESTREIYQQLEIIWAKFEDYAGLSMLELLAQTLPGVEIEIATAT